MQIIAFKKYVKQFTYYIITYMLKYILKYALLPISSKILIIYHKGWSLTFLFKITCCVNNYFRKLVFSGSCFPEV